MPRASVEKTSFSFVRGLITEASPLNFPEDASLDEENFELRRDGTRRRRLGVDYETGFAKSSAYASDQVEDKKISRHRWDSPGLEASLEFEVVRVGETLYYDIAADGSLSSNVKSFTVDLNDFLQPNSPSVGAADLDASSGFGVLYIVSDELEPFYIEYDPDADTISTTQIEFLIRDFEGVDDGLDIDERPTTLSDLHKYNLRNQGWPLEFRTFNNAAGTGSTVGDPIERTNVEVGVYPSNADIMYQFRDTSADDSSTIGSYNPFQLSEENTLGNTSAPKGHYLIDPFTDNKSSVSGIDVSAKEVPITNRPQCITFFAGRTFYGLGARVYFSQILSEPSKAGRCYQAQDPTAEDLNELLDNDGGVVFIPDAGNIRALEVFRGQVIVYAENGVWTLAGGQEGSGFSATGFQVQQISDAIISSVRNVRRVGDGHIAVAEDGIYITNLEEVSLAVNLQNITESTIQTYYSSITAAARSNSSLAYDARDRKVYWIHNADSDFDGTTFPQKATAVLVFDIPLAAFYKYTISPLATGTPYVVGGLVGGSVVIATNVEDVVDSNGDAVTDSVADQVVASISETYSTNASLKLLAVVPDGANYKHTFAEFNNSGYVDWESEDSTGADYTSFLETGYIVEGDIARNKSATYVITAMEQTEAAFVDNGSGGIAFDLPSSCLMRTKWEWASSSAGGKFGAQQQIYRLKQPFIAGGIGDPFDYGRAVVTAKNKVRGWGKALHIRFESETGKEARLLGWQIPMSAGTAP